MIRLKGPKDIGQNILMHLESANGGSVIPLIFEQNGRTSQLESSLIQKAILAIPSCSKVCKGAPSQACSR